MTRKKGTILGLLYGLVVIIGACAILEILIFSFYGGLVSALTNFDFNILFWAVGVSFFPTVVLFAWYGYRLSIKKMTRKQKWLHGAFTGFVIVLFAGSIGNIIFSSIENFIRDYPDYIGVNVSSGMLLAGLIYAPSLLPVTWPMSTLAINGLSKLVCLFSKKMLS